MTFEEERESDLLETLENVFGKENVFVIDENTVFPEQPKIDENALRECEVHMAKATAFLYSLDLKDEGEYRSMVKQLDGDYVEIMDMIIEHFNLPEDWS